jgi:tetratricopeptide (TPR) repeat protein
MTLGGAGRVIGGVLVAAPLVAGCAGQLLNRGDRQLVAGNYRAAITTYDEFLRGNPLDPSAGRVRATRSLLARYLQAEEEAARMRPELNDLRAQVARLKAALDKLRAIDVDAEQKR